MRCLSTFLAAPPPAPQPTPTDRRGKPWNELEVRLPTSYGLGWSCIFVCYPARLGVPASVQDVALLRAYRVSGVRHTDSDFVADLLAEQAGFIRSAEEVRCARTVSNFQISGGGVTRSIAGAEPVAGSSEAQGCKGTLDARGACLTRCPGWRAVHAVATSCCAPLSAQEDAEVIRLVTLYGAKKWSAIAEYLPGRIGKQCRER